MDRRTALLGIAALPLSCRCAPEPPPPSPDWQDLRFDPGPDAPDGQRALVFTPRGVSSSPVLVALHGRGESGRGLEVGARAWRDDYALEVLHKRCLAPPVTATVVGGMIVPERLE